MGEHAHIALAASAFPVPMAGAIVVGCVNMPSTASILRFAQASMIRGLTPALQVQRAGLNYKAYNLSA
jgi:hypothetical protein